MRYFWTFFWSFALAQMVTYVVGSIMGASYNFMTGTYLAVGITILVLLIPVILPEDKTEQHSH